jgi:hypothetical protein
MKKILVLFPFFSVLISALVFLYLSFDYLIFIPLAIGDFLAVLEIREDDINNIMKILKNEG